MDGLTFLKKLMNQHPIPVVVISTLTAKGADSAIRAFELGAAEVLEKPKLNTKKALEKSTEDLCWAVKAAAEVNVKKLLRNLSKRPSKLLSVDAFLEKGTRNTQALTTTQKVVIVGSSTGGTNALNDFLTVLPIDSPGIVIVQHMPASYTKQFAERLNDLCKITVKQAVDGETVLQGQAIIADGSKHLMIKRSGARYFVQVKDGPLVNRHKPSVGVLFRSAARYVGKNAIGIILTGMGADGAKAMLEMKEAGAQNIAQDEETCVVFGMPKEAISLGAAHYILPLEKIAEKMLELSSK
jgi:two-component system chemotaxis response regulator CheB